MKELGSWSSYLKRIVFINLPKNPSTPVNQSKINILNLESTKLHFLSSHHGISSQRTREVVVTCKSHCYQVRRVVCQPNISWYSWETTHMPSHYFQALPKRSKIAELSNMNDRTSLVLELWADITQNLKWYTHLLNLN